MPRKSLPPQERPDHIRSYGTRRGHLTDTQREAITNIGPQFCLPFDTQLLAPYTEVFGNDNPVTLEIGCGMGETTAKIAADNPDRNYIGIEVYPAGVGALLINLADRQLRNLRLIQYDAVEVLKHMTPPKTLAGVHILFPDPWPKKRHHKRRLIQPPFIELLVSRMRTGARLHCATDWEPYAESMLEVLGGNPQLQNDAGSGNWLPRPDWRPLTKFEKRGIGRGYVVRDLQFSKIDA